MLAEIKGIFTSCLRRITTTTSLGTTNNMHHRATWPQHHVHKLRQLTAVSCTPEALSKSMLAEIKGIFTSCLRRITTTTSLGTTTNMQRRATWLQHHVHKLRQGTAVSCTPEALSKSMLAEIKGIFTSCIRRITTTTSLGTTTNMQHHATWPKASRSGPLTTTCCFLHA